MELRELRSLIGLMLEHGLVELEIEDKKGKVRLVRDSRERTSTSAPRPGRGENRDGAAHWAQPAASRPARSTTGQPASTPELAPNQVLVRSPMVGTFYRSSSPNAEPFVEEGGAVRKGQPLCIIEAMKMMNEVEAEVSGSVVRILCDNGQPVEYGQSLMIIATD